jgi:hypothetical protein
MALQRATHIEITFPKRETGPSVVQRHDPMTLAVTRFVLDENSVEPTDMMYSVKVDGKAVLLLDGAEFSRMLNALGTGTW